MKNFDSQPNEEFGDAQTCSKAFEMLSAALKEAIADVHKEHLRRRTVSLELEDVQ